ncbi:putative phosphoribosyltransferase [Halopolyspora algeriensis]|uniref:Putative phosphoribosyltransferase n=1 Tax=Halopolyspora algeriensis TaxID=1500506 RepID=A0A368VVC0_9ACTN|nr:phosphoribosyltransferase family protein [Halopolyspora algeriensis]RCW46034.1 putative phosphoribosyltransferase [Halopolyspora algeriensis]TQM55446.1 putative phosphoribosyltransferase [Halopolyspora algeriensis]
MSRPDLPGPAEHGFADRRHGGRVLAESFTAGELVDPVVIGLARGGVPVAAEVARALHAPLRVGVARKIGAPEQPELALGAVTAHGPATYDQRLLQSFHTDEQRLAEACAREQEEARRREELYQQGPAPALEGRDVLLVDDGLATGATARAAVRMVRQYAPRSIVLAAPVGAADAVAALSEEADTVLCPLQPSSFHAVGHWYRDFRPTEDAEILALLGEFAPG